MFDRLNFRTLSLVWAVFSLVGSSYGADSIRILPSSGKSLTFKRTYSRKHLAEERPYQLLANTKFTIKNSGGLITGTWSGSVRDISRGEEFEASATSICKPRSSRYLECNFGGGVETAYVFARKNEVLVSIPLGHGVLFRAREKDGAVRQAYLFGEDEENNAYRLK
jgi:hypothetical protein